MYVHQVGDVSRTGVIQPELDVPVRDVVGVLEQVELVRLLADLVREVLVGRRDVFPLTATSHVVPLLQLDVVRLVALVPTRNVQVLVGVRHIVELAELKVVHERRPGINLGQHQLSSITVPVHIEELARVDRANSERQR